jgi:hyperosmotically inducible periplasmic protein
MQPLSDVKGASIMKYRKSLLTLCMGMLLGFGVYGCGQSGDTPQGQARSDGPGEVASDTAITTEVKSRLESEYQLRDSDISVSTADGEVTLEGSVSDANAKAAAEDAARSVEGVRTVHNNLDTSAGGMASGGMGSGDRTASDRYASDRTEGDRTEGGARQAVSDTWITTKVKSELLADSVSQGLDVNVETKDGVVSLQGTVEDEQAIEHVKDVVAGVEGVKRVDTSGLTVGGQEG